MNYQRQIVYVLSNPAMPGLVKIGRTSCLQSRLSSLNCSTAIPMPFECTYAAIVDDAIYVERQVHTIFAMFRVSGRREFFRVNPASVIAAIELVEVENITPMEGDAIPESPENVVKLTTRMEGAFTRDQAERDLMELLKDDNSLPGMTALVERWRVTKGCVSKWVDLFCEKGLIERVLVGRHVMLFKAGASTNENGQQVSQPAV